MIITVLEIAGSLVGYVLVGMAWARSQAIRLQRMINKAKEHRKTHRDRWGDQSQAEDPWFTKGRSTWERDLRRGLGIHAGIWPAFMIGRFLSKLNGWASAPVDKEREAAGKLREEAENIRNVADATEAPQEKNLLLDLAKDLLRQALDRDV